MLELITGAPSGSTSLHLDNVSDVHIFGYWWWSMTLFEEY